MCNCILWGMKVSDCDQKSKFDVSMSDVSSPLEGGGNKLDNDFYCKLMGRWVSLKFVGGEIWCLDRGCKHLADLTMTIPPGVFD